MSWNGVEVSRRIKIPRSEGTEVENEKTPPEELKRILGAADPRARVAASLIAFSGYRVEVLGSHGGEKAYWAPGKVFFPSFSHVIL